MAEVVDLRPYLLGLLRNWAWIMGVAVVAAIAAFISSSFTPPLYEASVLVVVTNPQQIVLSSLINQAVEPHYNTLNKAPQPLRALPEVAMSDAVLARVLQRITPPIPGIETVDDLRKKVTAESGQDLSVAHLTVRLEDPVQAAGIATLWGTVFIEVSSQLYGDSGGTGVGLFQAQLEETTLQLEMAEQAMIDFQNHNNLALLQNELDALLQSHRHYLAQQETTRFLLEDITTLRAQIAAQPATNAVTVADQVTALLLQVQTLSIDAPLPVQFQLEATNSAATSNQAQLVLLDNLTLALQTKQATIESQLGQLEPQILALQSQKQVVETENTRLLRAYQVAEESYVALARRVEEEKITANGVNRGVKMAYEAVVPEDPLSSHRLVNTAVAGLSGLVMGLLGTVVLELWKQRK